MQIHSQFLAMLEPLTKLPEGIDNECSICTEEFITPVALPCMHLYCRNCITEWLSRRNRNTCPICRKILFSISKVDREPVGTNRRQLIAQALEQSRLMTSDSFDIYDDRVPFTTSAVQQAAAAASQYLSDEHHPSLTGSVLIDMRKLGPHIIAMGNLLRGYARASGRPYSGYQRRDWKLVVGRLYTLLNFNDGQIRTGENAVRMARECRARIRESLSQDLIDVRSGRFFEINGRIESPSGDLDVLLNYVVSQCNKAFNEKEAQQAALYQAQEQALKGESTAVGWALRWAGQTLFGGV